MESKIKMMVTNLESIQKNTETQKTNWLIGTKMAVWNSYIHTEPPLMSENLVTHFCLVDQLVFLLIDQPLRFTLAPEEENSS